MNKCDSRSSPYGDNPSAKDSESVTGSSIMLGPHLRCSVAIVVLLASFAVSVKIGQKCDGNTDCTDATDESIDLSGE